MRNVDRNTVPFPTNLQRLQEEPEDYQTELNYIRAGGDAKGSIYGSEDVKDALRTLYICKCYLCGKDVSSYFEIEHFLPWHENYPERAYDWNNLHLSCKACNTRKRKKKYKIMSSTGGVQSINLLCPTVDDVNSKISYDNSTSEAINLNSGNYISQLTADFLNEPNCKSDRISHLHTLQETLLSREWYPSYHILRTINIQDMDTIDFTNEDYDLAGNLSYRITSSYLCQNAPFYTFIHAVLEDTFHLKKPIIYDFCRRWCRLNERPSPI